MPWYCRKWHKLRVRSKERALEGASDIDSSSAAADQSKEAGKRLSRSRAWSESSGRVLTM